MIPIIGKTLESIFSSIDKFIPDKDLAAKIKAEAQLAAMNMDHTEVLEQMKAQKDIILGEIQGESSLQRNWRPILMLTIVFIVANNYILFPYINLFFPGASVILELPTALWNLMQIGVGGYVIGRSGEKIVKSLKDKEK
jgi:hypothetical protein